MLTKLDKLKSSKERDVPARRPYAKPTLAKGPLLALVTAEVGGFSETSVECWVARAAFGETDIRWMIFRAWLLDDAPAWFRALYMRHGPAIGAWLARHNHARSVVRKLMLPAIQRKVNQ